MTLEEKLDKIDEPKLEKTIGLLPKGTNDTVGDFFEKFVKPRLPKKSTIKLWHRILMDYTDDLSNISCCVRYGNNGSEKVSEYGESGYYKLRRGWLTKNTADGFEYFFADNFFSSFIYKMALDGFVPADVKELRAIFRNCKFPYGFGFKIDKKVNEYKGVVIAIGKEPGFLDNYKLSHVFDAGEYFLMDDGSVLGDAELSPLYYPIGHSDDFLKHSDKTRKMFISPEAKKVIVAKFLRFAHPLNYFLTPSKKLHSCKSKVYKNDIGEDPIMIYYVRQHLKKEYPTEYAEFLDRIMWRDEYIGIEYERIATSSKSHKKGTSLTAPSKAKTAIKKPVNALGRKRRYTEYERIQEAAYYLRHECGLEEVELQVLGAHNSGSTAKRHLKALGIDDTSRNSIYKGMLKNTDIQTAIDNATGTFKETLEKIKELGL